jgi:hypothetical protein
MNMAAGSHSAGSGEVAECLGLPPWLGFLCQNLHWVEVTRG